ncbi:MAG: RusA family crossover junction endodeoxyribonuclease [Fusobacteriaceae bacterium]
MIEYVIILPFVPPSTNTYYRRSGHHMHISKKGQEFKKACINIFKKEFLEDEPFKGNIKMKVELFFKDKRRRDIDNYQKALQDSMNKIIFDDDCQIIELKLIKNIACGENKTIITISEV